MPTAELLNLLSGVSFYADKGGLDKLMFMMLTKWLLAWTKMVMRRIPRKYTYHERRKGEKSFCIVGSWKPNVDGFVEWVTVQQVIDIQRI